jgi:2-polyprenyl-3-methyl-5-hydroxy-6-metoxy-1,4-benzoquinol methylase
MSPANFRYSLKSDPYSSHGQIAAWLQRYKQQHLPQRPCVVYDIGCAQGLLGQLLPAADFTLYGVDFDPAAVELARGTYRAVWQADIEQPLSIDFPEPADVLILADVLEHTRDPEACLTRLCQTLLAAETPIVISLPNVAHLYVRLALLIGRFEYAARGICDGTHLRFFTKSSAMRFIARCGITIAQVAATPVPLSLLSPRFQPGQLLWPIYRAQAVAARLLKTVFGYQVIVYGRYRR